MVSTFRDVRSAAHKLSAFAPEDTPPGFLPDHSVWTEHVALNVTIDPKRRTLEGTCTLHLRVLAHHPCVLEFDAVELRMSEAERGFAKTDASMRFLEHMSM